MGEPDDDIPDEWVNWAVENRLELLADLFGINEKQGEPNDRRTRHRRGVPSRVAPHDARRPRGPRH